MIPTGFESEQVAGRDPVVPAQRSDAAEHKAFIRRLSDGSPAHSLRTHLDKLATIVHNTCRVPGAESTAPTFALVTTPNAAQQRALELLNAITV